MELATFDLIQPAPSSISQSTPDGYGFPTKLNPLLPGFGSTLLETEIIFGPVFNSPLYETVALPVELLADQTANPCISVSNS